MCVESIVLNLVGVLSVVQVGHYNSTHINQNCPVVMVNLSYSCYYHFFLHCNHDIVP